MISFIGNASTETLAASSFKNVPAGFRPSSVGQYISSGKGRLSDQIFPQVSADGLSFTDFKIDHKTGKVIFYMIIAYLRLWLMIHHAIWRSPL